MSNARNLANLLGTNTKVKDVDVDGTELILDADGDTSITADTDDQIDLKIAGVEHISITNSSGSTVVKPRVDAKDVIFQQFDGNEVIRVSDGRKLKFFDDGGESITSDGSNLKLESGGTTFTVPSSDGSDGQFLKTDGSGALSFGTVSVGLTGVDDQSSSNDDQVTITDSAVIINEDSDDVDFRVESNASTHAIFVNSGDERVSIFQSGTLNAAGDNTDDGLTVYNDGRVDISRASGQPLNLRRRTDNGNMLGFYKETSGSTANVGAVNLRGAEFIAIGSGDTNLEFNFGSDQVNPSSGTASRDNAINLGSSAARFKDAYLSGNLYIGGTGSANALNDYEEGTFTPAGSGFSLDSSGGRYTKIGNTVHCVFFVQYNNSGDSAGNVISGFPFTARNLTSLVGGFVPSVNGTEQTTSGVTIGMIKNTTTCQFFKVSTGAPESADQYRFGDRTITLAGHYETDS